MKRHPVLASSGLSRRSILGRGGVIAAALGLGGSVRHATAGAASPEMETHPIIGTWLVRTPFGLAPTIYSAEGTLVVAFPPVRVGPGGVTFVSSVVGAWEPISERGIHFTAILLNADADGNYTGSVTIDGHPTVGENDQTFLDDSPESTVTIRDADDIVLDVITGGPPVTAVRMGVGSSGFPDGTPEAGTPTS